MIQKILIAHPSWNEQQINERVIENGCCAYFVSIPMGMTGVAEQQGWVIPCVVSEDVDTSEIVSWVPVS